MISVMMMDDGIWESGMWIMDADDYGNNDDGDG